MVRPRERHDGVTPAAGSVAAVALARLGALAGDHGLTEAAERILAAAKPELEAAPLAFGELLLAAALLERGPVEIAVTGEREDLVRAAQLRYSPMTVLAWRSAEAAVDEAAFVSPLLAGREDGFAYVCMRGACLAPVESVEALLSAIGSAVGPAVSPRHVRLPGARHRRPGAARANRPGEVLRCLLLARGPEWVAVDVATGAVVRSRASGWPLVPIDSSFARAACATGRRRRSYADAARSWTSWRSSSRTTTSRRTRHARRPSWSKARRSSWAPHDAEPSAGY